jgi:hypothetical protein
MNDIPYRFLQLNTEPLINGYAEGRNFSETFTFTDWGCALLKPEIIEFFTSRQLIPSVGNLWSRPPDKVPKYYHTDRVKIEGKPNIEVAINWLLAGEPGLTQWSYAAIDHKLVSNGLPPSKIPSDWYDRNIPPEFTTVLTKPMLTRINIPHVVNTLGTSTFRVSYSLRFKDDPTWDYCLEQLKDVMLIGDDNL